LLGNAAARAQAFAVSLNGPRYSSSLCLPLRLTAYTYSRARLNFGLDVQPLAWIAARTRSVARSRSVLGNVASLATACHISKDFLHQFYHDEIEKDWRSLASMTLTSARRLSLPFFDLL
jgi:hypothetical protein